MLELEVMLYDSKAPEHQVCEVFWLYVAQPLFDNPITSFFLDYGHFINIRGSRSWFVVFFKHLCRFFHPKEFKHFSAPVKQIYMLFKANLYSNQLSEEIDYSQLNILYQSHLFQKTYEYLPCSDRINLSMRHRCLHLQHISQLIPHTIMLQGAPFIDTQFESHRNIPNCFYFEHFACFDGELCAEACLDALEDLEGDPFFEEFADLLDLFLFWQEEFFYFSVVFPAV